jgi:hypothetical protein
MKRCEFVTMLDGAAAWPMDERLDLVLTKLFL